MHAPFTPPARHILTLAQTLRGGGVERALLRLAGQWAAAGRRVTLLIGKVEGPLAQEMPSAIELVELGTDNFHRLMDLPALARQCAPDVIFCPGNHYTSVAGWTRLRLGRATPPIVAKISNALQRTDHRFPLAPAYRWWLRRHPGFIDHFVAMSEAMRAEAMATMRVGSDRISVIPNPPSPLTPGIAPGTNTLRPPDQPLLVGVGRLEHQKRWDRLIDAMAALGNHAATLTIVGEGSKRAALESQITALGLQGRVTLPGYAIDPAPLLAQAAAVVLTSDFEGVPGVVLEALAMGTPVVATDSSVAMREILRAPTQGTIVPVNDAAALVAALGHWLAPDAQRPAPVMPSGTDSAARYLALFDRLVAERGRIG